MDTINPKYKDRLFVLKNQKEYTGIWKGKMKYLKTYKSGVLSLSHSEWTGVTGGFFHKEVRLVPLKRNR